jgi:hypothetical protein
MGRHVTRPLATETETESASLVAVPRSFLLRKRYGGPLLACRATFTAATFICCHSYCPTPIILDEVVLEICHMVALQ